MHFVWKHCREETWAYTALAGIISFHVGIVVGVFSFKGLVGDDDFSSAAKGIGVIIAVAGVALVITSGVLYRRKRLHMRPCLCCGEDNDDVSVSLPPFRRLRFAPNLVSPYYLEAVNADTERSDLTVKGDDKLELETNTKNFQSGVNCKDSSIFTTDSFSQSSTNRKEHRKTPC